ncbi:MAG: hypothetical protein KME55_39720, partial [Nostoc indistinguendum CM1-VF10]|nr:hypothetical protein [Nostoc indistinguendum CM1-VF10]
TNRLDELFNSFINQQFFGDILRYVLCMNKYHLKTPKVNTLGCGLFINRRTRNCLLCMCCIVHNRNLRNWGKGDREVSQAQRSLLLCVQTTLWFRTTLSKRFGVAIYS